MSGRFPTRNGAVSANRSAISGNAGEIPRPARRWLSSVPEQRRVHVRGPVRSSGSVSVSGAREDDEGTLLNLDHRRSVACSVVPGSRQRRADCPPSDSRAAEVDDGVWSLWVLRLTSFDFRRAKVFPVFVKPGRQGLYPKPPPCMGSAAIARRAGSRRNFEPMRWRSMTSPTPLHAKRACPSGRKWRGSTGSVGRREGTSPIPLRRPRKMLSQVGLAEVRGYAPTA
jgi:hypothetical protein